MKRFVLSLSTLVLLSGCKATDGASTDRLADTARGTGAAEVAPAPKAKRPSASARTAPALKDAGSSVAFGSLPAGIGLPVGTEVPDVTLSDLEGGVVHLRALVARGPVLLVFYRGGWCPYCNFQVRELSQAYAEFEQRGVTPVLVSVDKADEGAKLNKTYDIPFPVLSDSNLAAHEDFKVLNRVNDAEDRRLLGMGMDLEASSGKEHHIVAVPAVFLLHERHVKFAHAETNYKVRPSIKQLLSAIDGVDLSSTPDPHPAPSRPASK